MDRHGRDAPCPEAIDLVFHQGDERRDDDAHAFAGEGRNLIGERLSAARGHQRQRVAPFHDGADDPLLHGTELREAPVAFQCVVYLVRSGFHDTKIRISREKKSKLACIFSEAEYLRRSQSANKRGQCQIYLNIAGREYLCLRQIPKAGRQAVRRCRCAANTPKA